MDGSSDSNRSTTSTKRLNDKVILCQLGVLLINVLFSIKYFSRYTDHYIVTTFLMTVFLAATLYSTPLFSKIKTKILFALGICILLVYILMSVFIFYKISVESLNVDRWSVITSFWQTYEKGVYVYFAKSNEGNPPGPMPFYFILAYPFYKTGELGLFSLITIPFFFLILCYRKVSNAVTCQYLFLLICMPVLWWEILCRSNVFLNSSLVLFSIIYFFNKDRTTTEHLIVSGVLFGLLISTRSVLAIAFIIAGIYAIKSAYVSFKQILILTFITLTCFVLTFVPFVYNHISDFWISNPFIVQSSFLMPTSYTIVFILLAFAFGFICRNKSDIYFYIFINLFFCIVTYLAYQVSIIGVSEAIFGRVADISYFIFCIPFALFYIVDMYTKKDLR